MKQFCFGITALIPVQLAQFVKRIANMLMIGTKHFFKNCETTFVQRFSF